MVAKDRTVNEIFKPFIGQSPFPNKSIIEKQAIKQPSVAHHYKTLDIVPASLQLDDIEIDLTAHIMATLSNQSGTNALLFVVGLRK